MTPSLHRTSSGMPGSSDASRRMSLGMTSRPAESMVVFMVDILPLGFLGCGPSGSDSGRAQVHAVALAIGAFSACTKQLARRRTASSIAVGMTLEKQRRSSASPAGSG
jgi:hypothetical protein